MDGVFVDIMVFHMVQLKLLWVINIQTRAVHSPVSFVPHHACKKFKNFLEYFIPSPKPKFIEF